MCRAFSSVWNILGPVSCIVHVPGFLVVVFIMHMACSRHCIQLSRFLVCIPLEKWGIEHTRKDFCFDDFLQQLLSTVPSQSSFQLTLQIFVNRQSIRAIDIYFGEHIKLYTIPLGKLFNHRLWIRFL